MAQTIIAESARFDALKQRINEEHRRCEEAVGSALEHAINAGDGLVQMKDNLPHGRWGRWLRENFEGSERTAQAYMRLYRRRDEIRNGASDLSIRGALSSLSVPKPQPTETVEEATVPSIPAGEVSPPVPYPPDAITRERAEGPLQWADAEVGQEHTEPREPGVIERAEEQGMEVPEVPQGPTLPEQAYIAMTELAIHSKRVPPVEAARAHPSSAVAAQLENLETFAHWAKLFVEECYLYTEETGGARADI